MGVKRSAKDIDVVPWCYVACRAPTLEEVIGIATDVFKTRLAFPCVIATVDMISCSRIKQRQHAFEERAASKATTYAT